MKTLIIDCNNLAYIARHAFGEILTHDEEQTGIMWGFFNHVWRLARQFETHKFLFAWDSRKSHRRRDYKGYKANRSNRRKDKTVVERAAEEKVYAQFNNLRKNLLPAFGFQNIYMQTGIEADDIIASLVLTPDWEEPPIIVSTDKDLYQLLEHCDIWRPLPGDKKELMTKPRFMNKFGLKPGTWVRARALEGDSSDNLLGVGGVGAVVALKFLKGELPPESRLRKRIVSAGGQIIMDRNVRLMTLPHPKTPVFPIVDEEVFKVDDFMTICDRYRFNYFLQTEHLREWRELFNMED